MMILEIEMSKHPYIGKGKESGSIVLFYGECEGVTLESKTWASSDLQYSKCINESVFENITADYLSNTKVKIESEEHAEFVIKLFNNAFGTEANSMNPVWVYNEGLRGVSQRFHGEPSKDLKQITIPLPPKQLAPTATQEEDFEMTQTAKNNGDNLIFGDADKCEEWPCVKDKVIHNGVNYYYLCKSPFSDDAVLTLCSSDDWDVISAPYSELQKPKTPEEELRDEIIRVIHDDVYNGMYSKESFAVFADALMSKFEITKKPQ